MMRHKEHSGRPHNRAGFLGSSPSIQALVVPWKSNVSLPGFCVLDAIFSANLSDIDSLEGHQCAARLGESGKYTCSQGKA
jgi:hypothetical protein